MNIVADRHMNSGGSKVLELAFKKTGWFRPGAVLRGPRLWSANSELGTNSIRSHCETLRASELFCATSLTFADQNKRRPIVRGVPNGLLAV